MLRKAAVSGTFYAGTREGLRQQVADLLPPGGAPAPALGIIVPHAGYRYSGHVAGAVYAQVAIPPTGVILGPNHTGRGAGAAIQTEGHWETPLGAVPIDRPLAQAIRSHAAILEEDTRGHLHEHSIEVQLPFLQYLVPAFRFVPICLFSSEYAACQNVGQAVAAAVRAAGAPVLLVASTDMSHYLSREAAAALDRKALDAMLALDPAGLHRVVRREGISMCGFHPTTAMLIAATALGATRVELVRYTDSGEVTGTTEEVVAYAGLIVR
jgi:MEMO1 family protein